MAGIKFDRGTLEQPGYGAAKVPAGKIVPDDTMKYVEKATDNVIHAGSQVWAKYEKMNDANEMAQRYMRAVQDMEVIDQDIQNAPPDKKMNATKFWEESVGNLQKDWVEGLRPDLKVHFDREIVTKVMEYRHKARTYERSTRIDSAKATMIQGRVQALQQAADLTKGDDESFSFLYSYSRDPKTGEPVRGPGPLAKLVNEYVGVSLIDQDGATRFLTETERDMKYSRAYRLASTTPTAYLALQQQEVLQPGSTFLYGMDEDKATRLDQMADARIERMLKGYDAEMKRRQEVMKKDFDQQGEEAKRRLATRIKAGDTVGIDVYIDELVRQRLLTSGEQEHFINLARRTEVEGGDGDPTVIRAYGLRSTDLDVPESFLAAVDSKVNSREIPFSKGEEMKLRAKATINAGKDRSKDHLKERHQAAQALADSWLTTNSPFEKLDQESANYRSTIREELSRISPWLNGEGEGRQDPLDYVYGRLPVFIKNLESRNQLEVSKIKPLLKHKDEKELLQAYKHLTPEQAVKNGELQNQIELWRKYRGSENLTKQYEERLKQAGGKGGSKTSADKPKGPPR